MSPCRDSKSSIPPVTNLIEFPDIELLDSADNLQKVIKEAELDIEAEIEDMLASVNITPRRFNIFLAMVVLVAAFIILADYRSDTSGGRETTSIFRSNSPCHYHENLTIHWHRI
jgi:hypothetical protein